MAQVVTERNPADLVRVGLEQVEKALAGACRSEVQPIEEAALHILGAGGKRVRPQLTLLTALAGGGSISRAVPLAAACELVHTATLVHDDIVDDSDSRRGRTAVQFYVGNSVAVLMGDYLVVRAFALVAGDPERRLWNILVDTISRMCEGEVLQICVKRDTDLAIETYETIIECKTALLMAACSQFGALVAGLPQDVVRAAFDFGYNVGMAFQIQDDVLDFVGNEDTLGKPTGGDLRESKVTLPVIYALRTASPRERDELLHLYEKNGPLSRAEIERATEIIEVSGGFEQARRHALRFIEQARRDVLALPPGEARDALLVLADQIVDRRR